MLSLVGMAMIQLMVVTGRMPLMEGVGMICWLVDLIAIH